MARITFIGLLPYAALTAGWQNHDSIWEILYCTEGEGTLRTREDETPFRASEFIALPPGGDHSLFSASSFQAIYLMIDGDYPFAGRMKLADGIDSDVKAMLMLLYRLSLRDGGGGRASVTNPLIEALVGYVNLLSGKGGGRREVALMERILEDNLSNPDFKLKDMYDKLYMHESHARALFEREACSTPREYLRRLRVERACQLLPRAGRDMTITEVARHAGIYDPQYFARLFRQETGRSPSDWLRERRAADTGR